jgi:dipeptidyl aminopeptidase/acylaminoacyl peptidase
MKPSYRGLLAAFCLSLAGAAWPASPPPEAFGRIPAVASVRLNPAGTLVAWIDAGSDVTRVIIHDLTTMRTARTIRANDKSIIRTIRWADDDTLLIEVSETRDIPGDRKQQMEWRRWLAADARQGDDRILLQRDGDRQFVSAADLVRTDTDKPKTVYMSTLEFLATRQKEEIGTRLAGKKKDSGWVDTLFRVETVRGKGSVIEFGTPFTEGWVVDRSAKIVVRRDWKPAGRQTSFHVKDGQAWRQIYVANDCGKLSLLALVANDTAVAAFGQLCKDTRARLWSIPLSGGDPTPLINDPSIEVTGGVVDPLNGALVAAVESGGDENWHWLDATSERKYASLLNAFKDKRVGLTSRSANFERVIARVQDASSPPIYYFVDFPNKRADIVNEAYPALANIALGNVRRFDYKARDQYALMGYLTIPAGVPEKNLPLVVMPHGGPEDQDDFAFDWLAQFLASRGYAVLQPQFRGSTGLGQAHQDAGRRQWGLRMQDDVTDGVRALVNSGIADAKRVCIVGWSYGGYAALAGAAFTPELYACAASIAGVSDLPAMLGHEQLEGGKESSALQYWRDHIGSRDDPQVIAKSPARAAAQVRAPILLLHGVDDTIVPIEQSRRMARALSAAQKPHSLVELPGEDHGLSTSAMRIRVLVELDKFLQPHLQAPSSATAGTH